MFLPVRLLECCLVVESSFWLYEVFRKTTFQETYSLDAAVYHNVSF